MPETKKYLKNIQKAGKKKKKFNVDIRRPYLIDKNIKGHILINLKEIEKNPYQPRKQILQESLQELANSISEKDVIQPIIVKRYKNIFQLVAGERRFEACKLLGKKEIRAIVKEDITDQDMLEIALIENIQRENLTTYEIAETYGRLKKDFNLTVNEIAKKVGKSRKIVNLFLQIYSAPKHLYDVAKQKNLNYRVVIELIKIDKFLPRDKFLRILEKVGINKLNVRQLEEMVVKLKKNKNPKSYKSISLIDKPFFYHTKRTVKFSLKLKTDDINDESKLKIKNEVTQLLNKVGFKKIIID